MATKSVPGSNSKNVKDPLDRSIAIASAVLASIGVVGLCLTLGFWAMQRNRGNTVVVPFWSPFVWSDDVLSLYTLVGRIPHFNIQLPLLISLGGFLILFLRDMMVGIHTYWHSTDKANSPNVVYRMLNYTLLTRQGLHPMRYFTAAAVVSLTDIAIFGALQMQWGEFQAASFVITMTSIAMLALLENMSQTSQTYSRYIAAGMAWLTTLWLLIPWAIFWSTVPAFLERGVSGFYWTMMAFRVFWTISLPFPIVWRTLWPNSGKMHSDSKIEDKRVFWMPYIVENVVFRLVPYLELTVQFAMILCLGRTLFYDEMLFVNELVQIQ